MKSLSVFLLASAAAGVMAAPAPKPQLDDISQLEALGNIPGFEDLKDLSKKPGLLRVLTNAQKALKQEQGQGAAADSTATLARIKSVLDAENEPDVGPSANPTCPQLKAGDPGLTRNELKDAGSTCKPVTVIYARGTDDAGNVGNDVGPCFFQSLEKLVGPGKLAVQGVDYPATLDEFKAGGSQTGASEIQSLLTLASQKCPDTAVVLSGFSQGAQTMHVAAEKFPQAAWKNVAAIMLFGDPNNGDKFPVISADKVITDCHEGDLICGLGLDAARHRNYEADSDEQAAAVAALLPKNSSSADQTGDQSTSDQSTTDSQPEQKPSQNASQGSDQQSTNQNGQASQSTGESQDGAASNSQDKGESTSSAQKDSQSTPSSQGDSGSTSTAQDDSKTTSSGSQDPSGSDSPLNSGLGSQTGSEPSQRNGMQSTSESSPSAGSESDSSADLEDNPTGDLSGSSDDSESSSSAESESSSLSSSQYEWENGQRQYPSNGRWVQENGRWKYRKYKPKTTNCSK